MTEIVPGIRLLQMLDSELTLFIYFWKKHNSLINSMLRNIIVKLVHLNLNIDKKHSFSGVCEQPSLN